MPDGDYLVLLPGLGKFCSFVNVKMGQAVSFSLTQPQLSTSPFQSWLHNCEQGRKRGQNSRNCTSKSRDRLRIPFHRIAVDEVSKPDLYARSRQRLWPTRAPLFQVDPLNQPGPKRASQVNSRIPLRKARRFGMINAS